MRPDRNRSGVDHVASIQNLSHEVRGSGRGILAEANCPLYSVKAPKFGQAARVDIDSASVEACQDIPAYDCGGIHGYQPRLWPAGSSEGVGYTVDKIRRGDYVNANNRRALLCPLLRSPASGLVAHQPDVASRH